MDTEKPVTPSRERRGVAMFVVLGAVLLVTLFGYVGLTLAGKDQTLSGDLNDIKSRDEAAIAGLQIAINRMAASPDSLVLMLNTFTHNGRSQTGSKKGFPDSVWIALDPAKPFTLLDREPDWFSLSAVADNKTAAKVRILAISRDTSGTPQGNKDSITVYVSLLCRARGRHADQKDVQATYRLHGISLDYAVQPRTYTVPPEALHIGTELSTSNLGADIWGDVYNSGGGHLNATAPMAIHGALKWNGDYSSDSSLTVDSTSYINGSINVNSHGSLRFKSNLGIEGGIKTFNAPLIVDGNLRITGSGTTEALKAPITVGGDFVYAYSNQKTKFESHSIIVGGNAWLERGLLNYELNGAKQFRVGKSLYVGRTSAGPPYSFNLTGSPTLGLEVVENFFAKYTNASIGPRSSIALEAIFSRTLTATNLTIGGNADFFTGAAPTGVTVSGSQGTYPSPQRTTLAWRDAPTLSDMGISATMARTSRSDNPMDSVKVDATNSPEVAASLQPFTQALLNQANHSASDVSISPITMNALYYYLVDTLKLGCNGYMVLSWNLTGFQPNFTKIMNPDSGFRGKALFVIENGDISINHSWPQSRDSTNIQIFLIRKTANFKTWGWPIGDLAGIFYWEDPQYDITFEIGTNPGKFWGAVLIGTSTKSPIPKTTFNSGSVQLIKSDAVFEDIGANLPNVLKPAVPPAGMPVRDVRYTTVTTKSPFLRLVHDRPYFEPLGVFR